ncbi:MAG: hypothetical protein CSB55_06720 [Candidatus Cloacimonadota bacterium]|nr:MAG: hypothetical protein CSB55_06720 [Candidatus Cloacimonadota bacterium]
MMLKKIIYFFLIAVFLILGCDSGKNSKLRVSKNKIDPKKPLAWGSKQEIIVMSDEDEWKITEDILKRSLEKIVVTTEEESVFQLRKVSFDGMEQFYKHRNIIFLSILDSQSDISDFVRKHLAANSFKSAQERKGGMFTAENVWANDQQVVFLIGSDLERLKQLADFYKDRLFKTFRKRWDERISANIYSRGIIPYSAFSRYPWTVQIPKHYREFRRNDENNFISYIARLKDNPDRIIGIYWEKAETKPDMIQWMLDTRDRIGYEFYEGDIYDRKKTEMTKIKLNDQINAIKMYGHWGNLELFVGGAFRGYGFWNEEQKICYFIDNYVYFPEGYKLAGLEELELIAKTFQPKKINKKQSLKQEN